MPQLRSLVRLRQTLIPSHDLTRRDLYKIYDDYNVATDAVRSTTLGKDVLGCLGFKLKLRGINPSLTEQLLGRMIPAFLLLDDSMLPTTLRGSERPKYFQRKVGKWITFAERFKLYKQAAGLYNPYNKRITYPLFMFDSVSWFIHVQSKELESGVTYTPHGMWTQWSCKAPVPLLEGSFGIFLHEYGHDLDFALQGILGPLTPGTYSSWTRGWKKLHEKEFTSPYGNTSLVEDFAETFTAFVLDPLLKCYAPGKYAWFAQFTKVNAAIYGSTLPFEGVDCSLPAVRELVAERVKVGHELRNCSEENTPVELNSVSGDQ